MEQSPVFAALSEITNGHGVKGIAATFVSGTDQKPVAYVHASSLRTLFDGLAIAGRMLTYDPTKPSGTVVYHHVSVAPVAGSDLVVIRGEFLGANPDGLDAAVRVFGEDPEILFGPR